MIPLPEPQIKLLREAAGSPDGTILAIGYNRHGHKGRIGNRTQEVHSIHSATALERRGLVVFVKKAAWGLVYRITDKGREAIP